MAVQHPNHPPLTDADKLAGLSALVDLIAKGWDVRLYYNDLGSITAECQRVHDGKLRNVITDNWTVARVLSQLADKVHKRGMYGKRKKT